MLLQDMSSQLSQAVALIGAACLVATGCLISHIARASLRRAAVLGNAKIWEATSTDEGQSRSTTDRAVEEFAPAPRVRGKRQQYASAQKMRVLGRRR